MPRKIIDISIPLEHDVLADPPGYGPKIKYEDHKQTAPEMVKFFPGLSVGDLPNGEGWAIEWISLATHSGTHLDAPYHFSSTMDHGKRAITIDEVPLDWCMQPGVKLDFRHFADGYVVTAPDVEAELARLLGPTGGHYAFGAARATFKAGARLWQTLTRSTGDYLVEESRDVVGRHELEAFHQDVEGLRDGVERLAARLEHLDRTSERAL